MTDASELLLPGILAMDVYHRDVAGGLWEQLQGLTTTLDDAIYLNEFDKKDELGFCARTYDVNGKIYIVYRGTDDGPDYTQGRSVDAGFMRYMSRRQATSPCAGSAFFW